MKLEFGPDLADHAPNSDDCHLPSAGPCAAIGSRVANTKIDITIVRPHAIRVHRIREENQMPGLANKNYFLSTFEYAVNYTSHRQTGMFSRSPLERHKGPAKCMN